MPTTIYDSSLITKRTQNKTIANSFISRIEGNIGTGSAPLLGITQQSILNNVVNGQITYYRKNDGGCTLVNLGCPCPNSRSNLVNVILPGSVQNISYTYGSLIVSWQPPIIGTSPFTYIVNLTATNPNNNRTKITTNLTVTFENSELVPGESYLISVTAQNSAGGGPITYYITDGAPDPVIGLYEAPTISVASSATDTCTLSYTFPTSGSGFLITSITIDPSTPLPSGWSISSFNNTQLVLIKSGTNPASIPNPGIKFIFNGSIGQKTNSSNFVTGIQTLGVIGGYWATNLGSNSTDTLSSIASDPDGNYYILGGFRNSTFTINNFSSVSGTINVTPFGTLDNSTGVNDDIFIVKYNAAGTAVWATSVNGGGDDQSRSITVDSSGNVYITGTSNSALTINSYVNVSSGKVNVTPFATLSPIGVYDAYLIKFDTNGQAQWATNVASTSRNEEGIGLCTDAAGNIYMTGFSNALTSIQINSYNGVSAGNIVLTNFGLLPIPSGFDSFVIKYNTAGQVQWATNIRDVSSNNFTTDITCDSAGNLYVIGYFSSSSGGVFNSFVSSGGSGAPINLSTFGSLSTGGSRQFTFIAKYDTLGQVQWATSIIAADNGSITIDNAGNIYATMGIYLNQASTTINSWGSVIAGVINVTPYADLPVYTYPGAPPTSGVLVKYNSNGIVQWATVLTGNNNTQLWGVSANPIDTNNNICIVGSTQSDPLTINNQNGVSGGTLSLSPYGTLARVTSTTFNVFIAKYDTNGIAQWVTNMSNTQSMSSNLAISVDKDNNVGVAGIYNSTEIINSFSGNSGGVISVTPYGQFNAPLSVDIFVAKYNSSGGFT
jgi:hypothetical protein